jgi:hypothetical protein
MEQNRISVLHLLHIDISHIPCNERRSKRGVGKLVDTLVVLNSHHRVDVAKRSL